MTSSNHYFSPRWHPSPEDLADYVADRLGAAADEKIRDHLVDCKDCADLVLELSALSTSAGKGLASSAPSEFEKASAWRRLRPRLFTNASAGSARRAWSVAAVLAVAAVGLGLWAASLQSTVAELRAPRSDPPLVILEPGGSLRAPDEKGQVELGESSGSWWLVLNLVHGSVHASYHLEFEDEQGRLVASLENVDRSRQGDFRLSLPRDFLPPGHYQLRLSGVDADRITAIAGYELWIESEAP